MEQIPSLVWKLPHATDVAKKGKERKLGLVLFLWGALYPIYSLYLKDVSESFLFLWPSFNLYR